MGVSRVGVPATKILLQDGRLVDLTASTATDSSGKDLDFRVEEVEAVNALEWCNTSNVENPDSFSLLENFVTFGNFLGLPVEGFEKEISSLMRKLESRKGCEKKEEIVVGYSFGESFASLIAWSIIFARLSQPGEEGGAVGHQCLLPVEVVCFVAFWVMGVGFLEVYGEFC